MSYRVYFQKNEGDSRWIAMGEIKRPIWGWKLENGGDPDSEGIILDPDNYEGEINHIEISHERKRRRNDALTEAEQTISRSELGN